MNYPKLNEIPTTRDLLDKFKGYNHNLRIGEGEFYDMQNLTGDDYPILSPRKKRGAAITTTNANGMCSNTKFCYVDGQDIILRDKDGHEEVYDLMLTGDKKELISMGANIIIMPDQKYINTISPAVRGALLEGIHQLPLSIGGNSAKPKVIMTLVMQDAQLGKLRTVISQNQGNKIIVEPESFNYMSGKSPDAYYNSNLPEGVDASEILLIDKDDLWYVPKAWARSTFENSNGGYDQFVVYGKLFGAGGSYSNQEVRKAPLRYFGWRTKSENNRFYMYPIEGEYVRNLHINIALMFVDGDDSYFDEVAKNIEGKKIPRIEGTPFGDLTFFSTAKQPYASTVVDLETTDVEGGIERKAIILPYDDSSHAPELLESLMGNPATRSTYKYTEFDTPITIVTEDATDSKMPKMDYIIESGNRLWGCRYGTNNNGDFVNEIYASALGDFKDWVTVDGISTDSYSASVGTSGAFTGAINYGGKPIFFKEDCMHRVFGDYPSNYQVQTIMCKGVQDGCNKSLAIVNDVLYYKSRSGICAFDGSLPVEISAEFGDKQYSNAVGGTIGNKYYVSMKDIETDDYVLFVYDTIKRMWYKEDNTEVTQFCNHKGELYYIDRADRYIHTIKGTGVVETQPINWGAETGILGATTPDDKYVTKIDIRMSVAKGAKVSLHIEYDSMGEWERLMEIEGLTLNTFTIPVRPRRCDHFRLKFEGEGDAKIFSISKTLEETE